MIDETHDPYLESWVESANLPDCEFPIQNLPFVTFRLGAGRETPGVAIGDRLLDLGAAFGVESVRSVMAMPKSARVELRRRVSRFLRERTAGAESMLCPAAAAELRLPCEIGDYTDFYASLHHATNVGSMFRPDNPLLPNYKWLPVAYHGRASSVVVSGTPVRRPWGQVADAPGGPPRFAPSRRLDYELEIGAFLGPGNALGEPLSAAEAEEHIVGVCLLNDWSARDIQAWEYQPLGPFLAKNFATSIGPWVITAEALEPFRRPAEPHDATLAHLRTTPDGAFDITVEAWLRTARMAEPVQLSSAGFASMYWTLGQMVAHHASNGCPLRAGDLIGSGTVSGPIKRNRGCLLELAWKGTDPVVLPNGEARCFLEDGDEIVLRGQCRGEGYRDIGLGECRGVVLAAREAVQ